MVFKSKQIMSDYMLLHVYGSCGIFNNLWNIRMEFAFWNSLPNRYALSVLVFTMCFYRVVWKSPDLLKGERKVFMCQSRSQLRRLSFA